MGNRQLHLFHATFLMVGEGLRHPDGRGLLLISLGVFLLVTGMGYYIAVGAYRGARAAGGPGFALPPSYAPLALYALLAALLNLATGRFLIRRRASIAESTGQRAGPWYLSGAAAMLVGSWFWLIGGDLALQAPALVASPSASGYPWFPLPPPAFQDLFGYGWLAPAYSTALLELPSGAACLALGGWLLRNWLADRSSPEWRGIPGLVPGSFVSGLGVFILGLGALLLLYPPAQYDWMYWYYVAWPDPPLLLEAALYAFLILPVFDILLGLLMVWDSTRPGATALPPAMAKG